MFILLWLMLTPAGDFKHFHVSTHSSKEACQVDLRRSEILVTSKNSKVVCVEIKR
tara:strand:- start:189 stop:353 length:165 start_codon:yes stop_codon:yes gene_type:complete